MATKYTAKEIAHVFNALWISALVIWLFIKFDGQEEQAQAAPTLRTQTVVQQQAKPMEPGLGITRKQFENAFFNLGIYFDYASPVLDGQPRVMAKVESMATMELIGDPANITQATLAIAPSVKSQLVDSTVLAFMFTNIIFSDWPESNQWIDDAIRSTTKAKKPDSAKKRITINGKTILVSFAKELAMLMITITPYGD